jgi:hypothetical protein
VAIYYYVRYASSSVNAWLLLLIPYVMTMIMILSFSFGLANSYLAKAIWGAKPKKTLMKVFAQGLLLLTMMLFFLPLWTLIAVGETYNTMAVAFITFISDAFISGCVDRYVALELEHAGEERDELASMRNRHWTCPSCGIDFVSPDESCVTCPECHRALDVRGQGLKLDQA